MKCVDSKNEKQQNSYLYKVKKGSAMQYKKCLKPEIRNGNHQQITVFDNMKVMKIVHWA